ncbi:MAG: hypothetical protein WCO56_17440 [Verrucomicrobiota bacterium]
MIDARNGGAALTGRGGLRETYSRAFSPGYHMTSLRPLVAILTHELPFWYFFKVQLDLLDAFPEVMPRFPHDATLFHPVRDVFQKNPKGISTSSPTPEPGCARVKSPGAKGAVI